MIENQLPAMPASKSRRQAAEAREHDAIGQHLLRPDEAQTGIGAHDRQHDHGGDSVVPAGNAHANTRHSQQFGRANQCGQHPKHKGGAGRPDAHLQPEWVAGEPVEDIDAKGGNNEGNGEVHQHGVDGMTGKGNSGADVLFGDLPDMRIRVSCVDFLAFLQRHFGFLIRRNAHRNFSLRKILAVSATPIVLAGCSGELSALDPAGPRAENLALLWWVMFWGAAVLFLLVITLFTLAYLRTSWLAKLEPKHWIVGGGLILPIPVLVVLTGTALVLGEQLLPHGNSVLRIGAHAERWTWQFTYPNGTVSEGALVQIPAGEPVDFVLSAEDVIHAFWVPRLGGKIDAVPGHLNTIRLEADRPGIYWGQCAEYCGEGHDTMFFRVEAVEPTAFAALMGEGQ